MNNVLCTLNLLDLLDRVGCRLVSFSSSFTVYGSAAQPFNERPPTDVGLTDVVARSRYLVEDVFKDWSQNDGWCIVVLRRFNPVGSHPSGVFCEAVERTADFLLRYLEEL